MTRIKVQQVGSVLLEALIAILIFSIGILALVGMQASAISTVSDAKYRSTAGFLANEIVGTMWAMRLANASAAAASNVTVSGPDPSFACNPCLKTNPNPYVAAWASQVQAALPGNPPTASIAIAGAQATVRLTWTPPDAASGAAAHQHVVTTVIN